MLGEFEPNDPLISGLPSCTECETGYSEIKEVLTEKINLLSSPIPFTQWVRSDYHLATFPYHEELDKQKKVLEKLLEDVESGRRGPLESPKKRACFPRNKLHNNKPAK
mmetsp:Transcript_32760/g.51209  ORF Transcript_32760/g.51209 Transcript_32760/m.51209 type:complete len:108 (+) Transcript_32760:750-1073(+)